ncbi:SMC-Scp complex subunit ScpB [Candidatus Micrarchaeota archaeon]|nr:SMC-Scp complex subunit ScpB [Candidatus Micrarchaeota archaeon]
MELEEKRLVEAALFISGRALNLGELRTLTGIAALGYLQGKVSELQKEYLDRASALEIIEENGKYEMRVRNDYLPKVKQFAQEMEISKNALRTLAYISKHDGMLKSELAKRIGPQIYQDVQELVENEFITTKKAGRTAKLFVTEKFKRHFSIANQQ